MSDDPFAFWSLDARTLRHGKGQWVHPQDRDHVTDLFHYHRDYLHTLPAPFFGPLRTAKLVLAYAGPGNTVIGTENDNSQGKNPTWVRQRLSSFNGETLVDWKLIQPRARSWFKGRLANVLGVRVTQLDEIAHLEAKVAFINLAAYRGAVTKWEEVAFLPSTHVMRNWARTTLFGEARRRKRVVLVMRANTWWGVKNAPWESGHLFAPRTNRSGYLVRECPTARNATSVARRAVGLR